MDYRELLDLSKPTEPQLAESKNPYLYMTERHLQAVWLEQKYFKKITTEDGLPIKVLSPGIWNAEAGPDFLKAHLQVGNTEIRGDIELHLSQDSWYHHQHHQDKRYDNVILHVSFWRPSEKRAITTSAGNPIFCVFLKDHLTVSETRLLKLIDLDLYPYQRFVGNGRCANQLFSSLPDQKTLSLFRSASLWRLEQKYLHLQEKLGINSDFLVGGMAMALGFKHNAEAFLETYLQLKTLKYQDEYTLFSYALGICGFFNQPFLQRWSGSSFYKMLKNTFNKHFFSENLHRISLRLDKIRPANHPVRRLIVMAKLLVDKNIKDLQSRMNEEWHHCRQLVPKIRWRTLWKKLIEILPNYADDYWEHHYTFDTKSRAKSMTLIGNDLKKEILLNIYFPLLYQEISKRNDAEEKKAFESFYAILPATKAKKTTYLTHRFFGNTNREHTLTHADLQQGAYQIHKDFCIHYEASCIGCPFVDKYKALEKKIHKPEDNHGHSSY